ncbi:MAG: glucose 1-dehydrogenase [Aliidiomarina sp.]|uniref:glucose 1-dehydrogenase n=1 Tax=Aliidiomarina sp. TaxID=1872439 RepID=UPI0025C5E619|nr:glucose 1-dehydrogenase [Aliidiomarina sp.]MCH8500623.1 glucose 1-dehydrogenase [Aliidiomarina sp.]
MLRLEGKIALVTGAAKGIGESIARHFAAEGAFVYVTDIDQNNGQKVASSLGEFARFALLDVRHEQAWQQLTEEIIDAHGRLDIVVNNAGITGFEEGFVAHDPEHATLDAWRKVHETNLDGVFLGCKYAIKAMRNTGEGSIINISSRSGIVGIPTAAAYASSKAAVRNHTKSVALYCAEQNLKVRCNSIHPAAILTPMWEPMLGTEPEREANMAAFVQDTPLRRFGLPEEVAAVAVMLASNESGYMTGAEINIDGGILAGSAGTPAK